MARWKQMLIGLGLVAGLAAVAGGYELVVSRSQAMLDVRHPLAPSTVRAATAPEAVAQGAHLSVVTACISCHGADLTGRVLSVAGSPLTAPNLTVVSRRLSDAEIDRAIRRGLRPDGTGELAMPSQVYAGFTDDEVAALIGYLRSLPPRGTTPTQTGPAQTTPARPAPGLMLRANLLAGVLRTAPQRLAEARAPLDAGPGVAAGRHLAAVACGQCHASDLGGGRGAPGPDLTVRGYYNRAQFHTLMRTGEAVDDSDMELMSRTARASFSHFSDGEIDAVYDYLSARDQILSRSARAATARP